MNHQINIFVEGHDDHELIVALLLKLKQARPHATILPKKGQKATTYLVLGPDDDPTTILVLGIDGWTNLTYKAAPLASQATQNLVIFDADDPALHPLGGVLARGRVLSETMAALAPDAAIFLLPDNQRDGNLETLLLDLISPDHQQVMQCFDVYDNCLDKYRQPLTGERVYYIPSEKRRVYDYVNVLPLSADERERHEEKGGQKIFSNGAWWNLDAPAIQPLCNFLIQHIQ